MSYVSDLDTPLLRISARDQFTLRDACQGVHVFGGVGSGKTSGSGKALAGAYLRAGFGGLVLAAKPDEVELWMRYARENGRSNSLIIFGERGRGAMFNFIAYELARQGADGTGSVIECLMRIIEASRLANPNASKSSEPFWEDAMRQVLRNSVPVIYAATGNVSIPDVIQFVSTAPNSPDQAHEESWQRQSFMYQTLLKASQKPVRPFNNDDYYKTASYWENEFAQLNARTRTNISISLSAALDRFNRGRLHRAFCTETTIVPELTFHGAIIVMDMSALTWNEDGVIAQQLFKFMWQRAVLSRNGLHPRQRDRPVFLWADEAQYFVNSFDADFQSTCRSSRACTVYLTQSLPTYYAKMGGESARDKANMLLANFVTKIFHNNADPETNRWASETIGRVIQRRGTYSEGETYGRSRGLSQGENTSWGSSSGHGSSTDGRGNLSSSSNSGSNRGGGENWGRNRGTSTSETTSGGYSEVMDFEIEAADFGRVLRTGGRANGGNVSAVWFQAGKVFEDSHRNYLLTRFVQ